jgi:hypothetical protein
LTNKNKVIAITFPDPSLVAKIHQFQQIMGVKTETEAARMMLERYCELTFKQREKLEAKMQWKRHRNKGFRSLKQFFQDKQKSKVAT